MNSADARRVDRRHLRALLRAYFVLSTRAMPVGITGAKRVRTLPFILGIYTLLGLVMGAMASWYPSTFIYSLTIHGMTFFVVGTMALNEASEVLFNARDADVLGYRPVAPSTLVLAKGLTILGFCGLMATAINLGACCFGAFAEDARGWFAIVHAGSVLIETVFLCAIVVCAHGVIARFLGAERFQRLVTAAQILSTVLLVVGLQVLPRFASKLDPKSFESITNPIWLLPPAWFAALDGWLASSTPSASMLLAAGVGIAVTALLAWVGVLRLPGGIAEPNTGPRKETEAPFARVAGVGGAADTERGRAPRRRLLASPIWSLWMRDPVERATFRSCAVHLLRDRTIQVRLAAGLAYFVVFPLITLLDQREDRVLPMFIVWMTALVPLTVLEALRLSSTPDSAEVFLFTPIRDPAALLHGARKAALAFVVLPLMLYNTAIAIWAAGGATERLWLVLPALFVIPPLSLLPGLRGDYVPLSQAVRAGERSAQVLAVFLVMIPMGIVSVAVYFAQEHGFLFPAVALVLALSIGTHVLLLREIRRRARFTLRR